MEISGLTVYPVKSCAGVPLAEARVTTTGLAFDRNWMLVDQSASFLTQRQVPEMAQIRPRIGDSDLYVSYPGISDLRVPMHLRGDEAKVRIWGKPCSAIDQGDFAASWFSELLGRTVRLVKFDPANPRVSDPAYAGDSGAVTAFADGFAILLTSQSSLDELNRRLVRPVPMDRFRPNVVVRGLGAFEEDFIESISAGATTLRLVKPCTRCVVTTTDQRTGERAADNEPLRTLASFRYRMELTGVCFGQNAIVAGDGGILRVGDSIDVKWSF